MGYLLASYKKAIFDELQTSISSNTSQYYAFASNPKPYTDTVPEVTPDNYSSMFENSWNMILGKRITSDDIIPVIKKNTWTKDVVYDIYDSNSPEMYERDNYYVVSNPITPGGDYLVYLCIDNANGSPSTVNPNSSEIPSQQFSQIYNFISLPDKYEWRFITSISSRLYDKFSTDKYVPIYANNNVITTASTSSGIDNVIVTDGGSGYTAYATGVVKGKVSSTKIRIENSAPNVPNFYANCSVYFKNALSSTSQLGTIKEYITAATGERWIVTENPLDLSLISVDSTEYSITPRVVFETDATIQPKAIAVINTSSNSISSITMYDNGGNISWANASIATSYGSGAVLKTVISPPGGHGIDPAVELNMKGYCVAFDFINTENGTVTTSNTVYNKIGLLKNPHQIISTSGEKGSRYYSNTFSSLLKADVSHTFTPGEAVTGSTSKARGTVAFANSTTVFLTGDKDFLNGELVSNSTSTDVTTINITSRGSIYTKDIIPLYVQNINNVNREENQSESFKLIIKL